MTPHGLIRVLLLVLTASTAATPAFAQAGRNERPYRGLFGDSRATLTSSISTFGGYDLLTTNQSSLGTTVSRDSGAIYGGVNGTLSYHRPVGKVSFDASGATNMHLYRQTSDAALRSHTTSGQMGIGIPVLRRAQWRAAQSFSASSYYNFSPFGLFNPLDVEDLPLPSSDARVAGGRTYDYRAFSSFGVAVGRYDTISADGSGRRLWGVDDAPTLTTVGGGARWARRVARAWTTQVGYGYEQGLAEKGRSAGGLHRIDAGASYAAPLSFSRRTRLAAFFGASMASYSIGDNPSRSINVPQVVGSATVSHQLGRTWSLGGAYSRQFRFSELTVNPTFTTSALMSLQGLPARRIGLTFSGGYATSTLDAGRSARSFHSLIGSARSQVGLSRSFALSAEYSYYAFAGTSSGAGTGRVLETDIGRHAVRVGLSAWVPLLKPRGQ